MNRPKAIGTAGETAVARYLQAHGFPHAERRALAGHYDLGDITGTPGLVWEVKAGTAAANASPGQIDKWLGETLCETQNAQADYGILICKRAGVGAANAGQWWTHLDLCDLLELHGQHRNCPRGTVVRLTLAATVTILRRAGYGTPPEEQAA